MKKILVHVHIYYKNLYSELKECLLNLKDYDHEIFFTLVRHDEELEREINSTFADAHVEVVDNLGFDVGPFVHVLNQVNLADYSYVIKLHTKRDIPTKESFAWFAGPRWRNALLKFIKTKKMFVKVLSRLETNPSIGMHGPNISTFNRLCDDHDAYRACNAFISSHSLPVKRYRFIAGTMFMVRAELLEMIKKLNFTQKDFESPDLTHEGCQMAHIFERFLGYCVISQGFSIVDCTTNVAVSKLIYLTLNLRKIIMTSIFTVRITKKNKLLVKILKIPVLAIPLKKKD